MPYEPPSMNTDDMRNLVENEGDSPETAAMVARLVASGMEPELAMIAVRQLMGMNSKAPSEWDTYTRKHPYMAATKKLGAAVGRPLAATAPGIGTATREVEKVSAAGMLRDYLMAQDRIRAGEAAKGQLNGLVSNPAVRDAEFMRLRMPGQPMFGEPIYTGPTPERSPQDLNQMYSQQYNEDFDRIHQQGAYMPTVPTRK